MQGWVSSLSCQFCVFLLFGKTGTDPEGGGVKGYGMVWYAMVKLLDRVRAKL